MQTPSVGRIVHYVSHGTPVRADGTQVYTSQCRAAVVTGVYSDDEVALCVLNPTGLFFHEHCLHDAGGSSDTPGAPETRSYEGGTWHWPERV